MQIQAKKVEAWQDSQGTLHSTIEDWKRVELGFLISPMLERVEALPRGDKPDQLGAELLAQQDALLSVLTTGPRSRPGARKKPGTTSPRRAAKRATPAQAREDFKAMRDATNGSHLETTAMQQDEPAVA